MRTSVTGLAFGIAIIAGMLPVHAEAAESVVFLPSGQAGICLFSIAGTQGPCEGVVYSTIGTDRYVMSVKTPVGLLGFAGAGAKKITSSFAAGVDALHMGDRRFDAQSGRCDVTISSGTAVINCVGRTAAGPIRLEFTGVRVGK